MRLNFQHNSRLYDNWLFYIQTVYLKYLLFHFLYCGTEFQNGRIICLKDGRILTWCLFSEINVTCVLIASFIFWIFTVNASFFSSLVAAFVCTFPSSEAHRGSKTIIAAEKIVIFCQKNVPFKLNFQHDGQLFANCLI